MTVLHNTNKFAMRFMENQMEVFWFFWCVCVCVLAEICNNKKVKSVSHSVMSDSL